jgi:hypothetical protein
MMRDYTPNPFKGMKWTKDRKEKKTRFWGQPKNFIEFDNTMKAQKGRVRAAAMAAPGFTWQQAAVKGKLNPQYWVATATCSHS